MSYQEKDGRIALELLLTMPKVPKQETEGRQTRTLGRPKASPALNAKTRGKRISWGQNGSP